MKRRNFIKGLFALAAAPLALREISATQELAPVSTFSSWPEPKLDKSTIRKIEEMLCGAQTKPYDSSHIYVYEIYYVDKDGNRYEPREGVVPAGLKAVEQHA